MGEVLYFVLSQSVVQINVACVVECQKEGSLLLMGSSIALHLRLLPFCHGSVPVLTSVLFLCLSSYHLQPRFWAQALLVKAFS